MKNCSVEGCTNHVFGKHFCKYHYPSSLNKTSPLPKNRGLFSKFKSKVKDLSNIYKRNEMFREIWSIRLHYSQVSHTFLGDTMNSMYFHHILPKNKYPEAEFDEMNIILLTPEEHANVESNIYRYPVINEKREFLNKKYNIM